MFAYYLQLALRSLKRNVLLTSLMIAAIGVGIGASMTTLTLFRAMSRDPIPHKSAQLFAPQIDNLGPKRMAQIISLGADALLNQLTYVDAINLMNAHAAQRQSAMYTTALAFIPDDAKVQPFQLKVRAAYADFFAMFDVPFRFGAPWGAADDTAHAQVVVLTRELNDKMFGGANSVGRTVNLDGRRYRVAGVMERWDPLPRFYDLNETQFGKPEELYLPFTRAIDEHMPTWGNKNCSGESLPGWEGQLRSECVWLQFWAELPTAAAAARYRAFLDSYAADQRRLGRFQWPPHTRLSNVREWLLREHVVGDQYRVLLLTSFSFLLVCLMNAMGLLLAKIMGRIGDISVRRALGATRRALYAQYLIEAGVIGVGGAALGLLLTLLGLAGLRALLSEEVGRLTHLDGGDVGIAVALAVAGTLVAGVYPAWRAAQCQPAWQLKAQ